MKMDGIDRSGHTAAAFNKATKGTRVSLSPLTLRLTAAERTRLDELADGMTRSAYVRACLFAQDAKLRKGRPSDVVAEKKAAAEALALLGQSRIASNLNQLAYHANVGALIVGQVEKDQIAEATQAFAASDRSI